MVVKLDLTVLLVMLVEMRDDPTEKYSVCIPPTKGSLEGQYVQLWAGLCP